VAIAHGTPSFHHGRVSQGTRDLNPQPSVLETDALPVELVPSDEINLHQTCGGHDDSE
jgi:hypothetical protein